MFAGVGQPAALGVVTMLSLWLSLLAPSIRSQISDSSPTALRDVTYILSCL